MMNDIVTPKRDAHFFWTLFKSTFLISAFTVGGGFVIIPLLKGKYVDEYHWISDKDTLDMVAIAQSMPGVIAVNSAVILGYRMAGVLGTLVALVATVLPCLITLSIISYCYDFFIQNLYIKMILRGMQCGATALIVNVGIDLLIKQGKKKLLLPIAIIVATFIANLCFDVNIMALIVIDGIIGFAFMRDKKYDYIVKELSGSTLDEQAKSLGTEVADFDNVTFGAFYVNGPGFEPRLIGAISSTTEKGVLSAPVKGLSGVYVFEVDDIQTSDKQTAEGEKVRAQAMAESMAQQFSVQAIQQMAKIQDLRGKYF